METIKQGTRGGARPGAGRPLQGTGRKYVCSFMLSPEGMAARDYLRRNNIDVNAMVDAFLRRNAYPVAESK